MKRSTRLLPVLGWTMAAACSGGGDETRGAASSDGAASGDPPGAAASAPASAAAPRARAEGRGGSLTVSGKDHHGHDIELSVRCERFDEVVPEGG